MDKCYKTFSDYPSDVESFCENNLNSYFVKISSPKKQSFIELFTRFQSLDYFLIGIIRLDNDPDVTKGFMWMDETGVNYHNFKPGTGANLGQDRAVIRSIDGFWTDNFPSSQIGVLCELKTGY